MARLKILGVMILAVTSLLAFSACGDNEDAAAAGNVLNVAVFEGGYGRDFWIDLNERFEDANPGVAVNMQISPDIESILAPQLAVGEIPDVMVLEPTYGFMISMNQNEEFLDLTNFFNNTEVLDRPGVMMRDIIVPGMLESTAFAPFGDGRIFHAPLHAGPMGPVYNITLFEEKGWSLPTTWDEWFAMDALMDDPANHVTIGNNTERRSIFTYQGIHPGYLESVLWPAIAGAGGMEVIHAIENYEEGSWNNTIVRQVLQNLARMGTDGYLMSGTVGLDHTQSQADMMMGRALFIPNGTWFVGEMADAPREPGFEFAIAPVPTLQAGQPRYVLSSFGGVSIPAEAPNTDLALDFLAFMYTSESIRAFAKLADGVMAVQDARTVASAELDPSVYNMMRAYDEGIFMLMSFAPIPPGLPIHMGNEIFDNRITPLMTGSITVDEYIQQMEELNAQIRAHIAANS